MDGFNYLKATEPLQRGSLLFTTKFPEIPGIHLINLGRMKDWASILEPHSGFQQKSHELGIQLHNH